VGRALLTLVRKEPLEPYRDPNELRELIESDKPYFLVDVRSREEFGDGYIPTAMWIPHDRILKTPPTDDKNALIILYSYSGVRSEKARRLLKEMGYRRVYNFGGIIHWPGELVGGPRDRDEGES
jgi:phage shock protein E